MFLLRSGQQTARIRFFVSPGQEDPATWSLGSGQVSDPEKTTSEWESAAFTASRTLDNPGH